MSWHGIPIPYTDRADWLEKRKPGIGASDVAGILGLSPWSSPYTVWADKTQDIERDANESMEWGKLLEDVILERWANEAGLYTGGRELLVAHPEIPWVMATVDALAFEHDTANDFHEESTSPSSAIANVQVKTDGGWARWEQLPDHVRVQVQWEMLATGLDYTWVPVLHGGRRFEVYEAEADPGLQAVMLHTVTLFRDEYLVDPSDEHFPDPMGTDDELKVIADLYPGAKEDEVIEISTSTAADVALLEGLKAQAKSLEEQIKKYSARVKVSLGDATIGNLDGVPRVTWKPQDGTWVERHYRQPSRTLLIKPIKEKD